VPSLDPGRGAQVTGADLLLRGVRLIDGTGAAPLENAYVLIMKGQIVDVGTDEPAVSDVAVYDLAGYTVMPGLIDGHVHLLSSAATDRSNARAFDALTFVEEKTLHAAANAAAALAAGVTTVRDMAGSRPEVAVKHASADGVIEAARVVSAGFVGMTGGHGDMFLPPALERRLWQTADGPTACRSLVRSYARDGHDLVKICTSGGVLSSGDRLEWRNYTDEEVVTVTDEAHALGMRVAAHAHTKSGVLQAVLGGVDTIEHGSMVDEECVQLLLDRDVALCPTLTLQSYMASGDADPPLSAAAQEKARIVHRGHADAVRLAHGAGVRIFAGTDSCNTMPFGRHARELGLLVELAGMSSMQALVAATSAAARALAIEADTGSLVPGKSADLLVVDGDPLQDVRILEETSRLHTVMMAGRPTSRTAPNLALLRASTNPVPAHASR
jgi:imidazolonepropionase-like amidohydrolase